MSQFSPFSPLCHHCITTVLQLLLLCHHYVTTRSPPPISTIVRTDQVVEQVQVAGVQLERAVVDEVQPRQRKRQADVGARRQAHVRRHLLRVGHKLFAQGEEVDGLRDLRPSVG